MNAATRFALCILVGALSGNGHAVADVVEFEANFSTEFALGCIGEMSDGTWASPARGSPMSCGCWTSAPGAGGDSVGRGRGVGAVAEGRAGSGKTQG